jgi:hypothetical protein
MGVYIAKLKVVRISVCRNSITRKTLTFISTKLIHHQKFTVIQLSRRKAKFTGLKIKMCVSYTTKKPSQRAKMWTVIIFYPTCICLLMALMVWAMKD